MGLLGGSLPAPNIPKIVTKCYCTVTIFIQFVHLSKSRRGVDVADNLISTNSWFELYPERYAHMTPSPILFVFVSQHEHLSVPASLSELSTDV
jgi:hypothetical protein